MRLTGLFHTILSLFLFLSAGIASAGIFSRQKPTELAVRTTAYTHSEADHLKYGRKTAAGGTLKYGRSYSSAAADWSKFPLGTKFKIDGMNTTFVVDDYGRALVGTETIDIYKPSRSAMNQWGVKHVDIEILEYGDYEKSREILEERTKYAHVRQMLAGIDKNPGPKPQKKSKSDRKRRPFFSFQRKTEPAPVIQLASAPPAPIPEPASAPASVKPAVPASSKIPAPPLPAATSPSGLPPQLAASAPVAIVVAESQTAASKIDPAPSSAIPAPVLRKVKPLHFAQLSASIPSAEPVATIETPAREKPAVRTNQLRKRAFRPLIASVNG